MNIPKSMFIEIGGGLGNQLFIWATAHLLNVEHKIPINIIYNYDRKTSRNQIIEITELVNSCSHDIKLFQSPFLNILFKSRDKFVKNSNSLGVFFDKYLKIYTYDTLLGNFRISKDKKFIRGSFVNSLVLDYLPVEIVNELELYISKISLESLFLPKNNQWQTLHIRRGDLRTQESPEIFAFNTFYDLVDPNLPLVITTDDSNYRDAIEFAFPKARIFDEKQLTPWQALALMANGSQLIAPNSTLSWWASIISIRKGRKIFAPSTWKNQNLAIREVDYYQAILETNI